MKYLKLKKSGIPQLFENLKKFGVIYAPVKKNGLISFQRVEDFSEVFLEYTRTQIPPKHLVLPQEEPILRFRGEDYSEILSDEEKILFGVHPCDIIALKRLDEVYLQPPPDTYYHERMKKTTIIGVGCIYDESCFCRATNSFYASEGFDIFLHDCGDFLFLRIATPRGLEIVDSCGELFEEAGNEELKALLKVEKERAENVKNEEMSMVGDLIELSDDEIWREFSERCLNCGTCTIVCPTCQCFEVYDKLNDDLESGERIRRWDSCMFKTHGLIADGHNFRGTTEERLKNRLSCKIAEMRCVGCGRCTVFCPAGINILEIVRNLRGG